MELIFPLVIGPGEFIPCIPFSCSTDRKSLFDASRVPLPKLNCGILRFFESACEPTVL